MQKLKSFIKTPLFFTFLIFLSIALIASFLFQITEIKNSTNSFFDAIWWSVVTMSTTGYGDIVPSTYAGKLVAIFAMILGIAASSLLTGTIASVYFNNINRHQRGHMKYKKIREHLIICGWKNNMQQLLLQIVEDKKNAITADKIIIVANPPQEVVDTALQPEAIAQTKFIRGDFYDKENLKRANVEHAKKAFILTDSGSYDESRVHKHTPFEVDSRTVMTVLSIKSLNQNVYVSAQLLERNFELYLQKVNCDEILFPRELNETILSKTVLNDGMSNIIQALITGSQMSRESNETTHNITTEAIKNELIGKTYEDLQESYKEKAGLLLIGVLENISTYHNVYNSAIREAQKTSNFADMVQNMRQIKALKSHKPIFIPPADYIIQKYSAAILLERTQI